MKKLILLKGPPGCGKRRLGKVLKERYDFAVFETSALLKNANAAEFAKISESGDLAPDRMVLPLILRALALANSASFDLPIMLDGFPRNLDQAYVLESWAEYDRHVCVINLPKKVCFERILSAKDRDNRKDDAVTVVRHRFEVFNRETQPALDYLRKSAHVSFHDIDGFLEAEEKAKFLGERIRQTVPKPIMMVA